MAGLGLAPLLAACAAPDPEMDLSERAYREDLAVLAERFPRQERSLTGITRGRFERRVAELRTRTASMTPEAFIMGVQWAVAAADNAHTKALVEQLLPLRLPIELRWFAEGLYVVATKPVDETLLGARVVEIEGRPTDAVLLQIAPYFGGTKEYLRVVSLGALVRPELLYGVGLAERQEATRMTFRYQDGAEAARELHGQDLRDDTAGMAAVRLVDRLEERPLYLRHPKEAALLEWLSEKEIAYVRLNTNRAEGLREDLAGIRVKIEQQGPKHAIVDLRLNGGGNMLLTADFAEALPGLLPPEGRLVIITANQTFSAGIVTAAILKAGAGERARLVGEEVGDRLKWWSEDKVIRLPNSGLKVLVNDGFHDWQKGFRSDDPRYRFNPHQAALNERYSAAAGNLAPDAVVVPRFSDYAAGEDPVLETAMEMLRP
jgi:hypothetical protein